MKLRLTVRNGSGRAIDIQLLADVTATVGQTAHAIAMGSPEGSPWRDQSVSTQTVSGSPSGAPPMTLRVRRPGDDHGVLLDSAAPLAAAGVRSGSWVEAVPVGRREPGDCYAREPRALLRCLDGPQQGMEFPLFDGPNLVGRHWQCRVRLTDPRVSRVHARIDVEDGAVAITDVGSRNGTVISNLPASVAALVAGSEVRVGGTSCLLVPAAPSTMVVHHDHDGDDGQSTGTAWQEAAPEVTHLRSARVVKRLGHLRVALPAPPLRTERQRPPLIAMTAPLLLGAGMYAMTRSTMSLMFVALTPVIMVATWLDSLLTTRRKRREGLAVFDAELRRVADQITEYQDAERRSRQTESPPTAAVLIAMSTRSGLLWTRRAEHREFCEVRWGDAMLATRLDWDLPGKADSEPGTWKRMEELRDAHGRVGPVPVLEQLDRAGNLGVVGSGEVAQEALCAIVMQLTGLHSPHDLVLSCFAEPSQLAAWGWLKWLPHVASISSPVRGDHLAGNGTDAARLLAQLEEVLGARRDRGHPRSGRAQARSHLPPQEGVDVLHGAAVESLPTTPVVIVVVLSDALVETSRLLEIAEQGPDWGIHLIWLAKSRAALPATCRTFAVLDGPPQVGYVREGELVALSSLERVPLDTAATVARQVAAVVDAGARGVDESDLPASVSYSDLVGEDPARSPQTIVDRWEHDSGLLDAVVGQESSGLLSLSLREHGPHALVGGTTGAGKSEFLQTWIMSLAATHSPERVTFLLIDYKGGAAFAECVGLPHTVGLVTDLTPPLVRRALTSLRAELRHRERLLAAAGAKDLVGMEAQGDPRCPPALVIVVDEFAALVSDVPEFIDGLVDVAQRGRSLGLHVVLATQRPAGVIRESLRANMNLRVALRVADEADSQDVVGVKDAAGFDPRLPGRAVAKVGPGAVRFFQTGYLGGHSVDGATAPQIEIQSCPFGVAESWTLPQSPVVRAEVRDIECLTDTIRQAAESARSAPPRRPWLDALGSDLDLRMLVDAGEGSQAPAGAVVLGLQDEPEHQRYTPFTFRPDDEGSMVVFGASRAGKSGALRALTAAVSHRCQVDPVELYVIDAAGGALASLESLATVGAVIRGDDDERVHRLLRTLVTRCEARHRAFADANAATLTEFRRGPSNEGEPRVYLLVDGLGELCELYDRQLSGTAIRMLTRLIALGRQAGVHVVATADRSGAMPSAMSAGMQARMVLRMASETDYAVLGVAADQLTEAAPGRGVYRGHEVQWAVWGGSGDLAEQAAAVEALARRLDESAVPAAPAVPRLPSRVAWSDLPRTVLPGGRVPVGLGDEDLATVAVPWGDLLVVSGPAGSGRTTTIRSMLAALAEGPGAFRPVVLSARRSSELSEATSWFRCAWGSSECAALAGGLAAQWSGEHSPASWGDLGTPQFGSAASGGPGTAAQLAESPAADAVHPDLLVVEASAEFEGTPAEAAVAAAIRMARRAGCTVVVETEPVTGAGAWRIQAELKSARAGIVLQPEDGDALSLFRVPLPRGSRADFPVGRGYLIERGVVTKLQVALPPPRPAPGGDVPSGAGPSSC